MKNILIWWFLAMGLVFGPAMHEAFVWHQIEGQAVVADLVEGAQK